MNRKSRLCELETCEKYSGDPGKKIPSLFTKSSQPWTVQKKKKKVTEPLSGLKGRLGKTFSSPAKMLLMGK